MTLYKKNFNINPTLLTNVVFGFFPISFILGNFIINLNVVIFCCLGIFKLKSKILKTKFDFPTKIIFLLFCIIFFSSSLSLIEALYLDEGKHANLINLTKSIIFFRFFLMLIIVCLLHEFNILDFKYIFISAAFCSLLISLDVIFQYIFGFNIIGLKSSDISHNSGFFGEELIAGGFIQNFSFFSIFFVTSILKNKNNFKFILSTIIICILGVGIILSGNRMPGTLFLFGLLLTFFFNNELRKIIFVSIIGLLIIFKFIISYDDILKHRYATYVGHATNIIIGLLNNPLDTKTTEPTKPALKGCVADHPRLVKIYEKGSSIKGDPTSFWTSYDTKSGFIKIYYTTLDTWKKNKIFGNGIKSFRVDCLRYNYCYIQSQNENRVCSSHPHNYYLEILTETGIIGLFTTSIIALMFLVFIFKNFKFLNRNNLENLILLAATVSLILKTFPIQSTGSIFTTNSAAYLILISSIVLSYKKLLAVKNFK